MEIEKAHKQNSIENIEKSDYSINAKDLESLVS